MNIQNILFDYCGAAGSAERVAQAADVVVRDVLALSPGETFLIIGNPCTDSAVISTALYNAAVKAGAVPSLIFQPVKTQVDYAEDAVIYALRSAPSACASISHVKLGKDKYAMEKPYVTADGKTFTSTFDYHNNGLKDMKSFWSPGITVDMFCRTAAVDYQQMREQCRQLKAAMTGGVTVHVTSPGGTDVTIGIDGRTPFVDDGDFTSQGLGGNVPAGEVFISPSIASASGVIVFDGTVSLADRDVLPDVPVSVTFTDGYISAISGGETARQLEECITGSQKKAAEMEAEGKIPVGSAAEYIKNARHLGELGIGLNPAATICCNMLEAEKAFHTCHFAIGTNYDDDADALIHLDCLVKNPDITVTYKDGTKKCLVQKGEIV